MQNQLFKIVTYKIIIQSLCCTFHNNLGLNFFPRLYRRESCWGIFEALRKLLWYNPKSLFSQFCHNCQFLSYKSSRLHWHFGMLKIGNCNIQSILNQIDMNSDRIPNFLAQSTFFTGNMHSNIGHIVPHFSTLNEQFIILTTKFSKFSTY